MASDLPQRLLALSLSFLRVGLFTFGGGQAAVPLIHREAVKRHNWMSEDEFIDLYALASALPGPIGTNMGGYVGHCVAGSVGACISVAAQILPTAVAMILFATLYLLYQENPLLNGFLAGLRPAVVAMLLIIVIDFYSVAIGGVRDARKRRLLWFIACASLAAILLLDAHPAIVIITAGTIGILVGSAK